MEYLVIGITLGLSAGFSPGPLVALVISQTLTFGIKEGIITSFAPLVTDIPIVILSVFLMSEIYRYKTLLGWISIGGAFFVAYLAYKNFRVSGVTAIDGHGSAKSVSKAALVNFLSPNPYLFWISVGSPIVIKAYAASMVDVVLFLVGFYSCLIGGKCTIGVLAHTSRGFLNGPGYTYMMRGLGILLLLFAVLLFRDGWASL